MRLRAVEHAPQGSFPLHPPLIVDVDPPRGRRALRIAGIQLHPEGRRMVRLDPGAFPVAGAVEISVGHVPRLCQKTAAGLQIYVSPINIDPASPSFPSPRRDRIAASWRARSDLFTRRAWPKIPPLCGKASSTRDEYVANKPRLWWRASTSACSVTRVTKMKDGPSCSSTSSGRPETLT